MAFNSAALCRSPQLSSAARNQPALAFGSRGEGVVILQLVLNDMGYALRRSICSPGGADGIFGSETRAAVCEFQGNHQLDTDGVAGAMTLQRLDQVVSSGWFATQLSHAAELSGAIQYFNTPQNRFAADEGDRLRLRHIGAALQRVLQRHGKPPTVVRSPPLEPDPVPASPPAIGAPPSPSVAVNTVIGAAMLVLHAISTIAANSLPKVALRWPGPNDWSVPKKPEPGLLELGVVALALATNANVRAMNAILRNVAATMEQLKQCMQMAKSDQCRQILANLLVLCSEITADAKQMVTLYVNLDFLSKTSRLQTHRMLTNRLEALKVKMRLLQAQLLQVLKGDCCPGLKWGG